MHERGEPFQWDALVPRIVHPRKVAIIETMAWMDRPFSAVELSRVFDEEENLGLISYHLKALADMGVVVKVGARPVRGALENFYFFASRSRNGTAPKQPL